ncbi:MAG: hypothetical protein WCR31_02845 [Treponema sp.]
MSFEKGFIMGILAALGGLLSAAVIKEHHENKRKMNDDALYNLKDAKITGPEKK